MYIAPDSKIYILKNCPIPANYQHTIYFTGAGAQAVYFEGLAKYKLTQQSYQRATKNTMRVEIKAEDLYDCNYLMFQNTSFGTKWFYAFITDVEYINNITSEITYSLDVLQTWHFDYALNECFVEREHSATDNVGDNTIPETVELGPILEYVTQDTGYLRENVIVVAATFNESFENIGGAVYGGIYSGCMFHVFEDASAVEQFLLQVAEKKKEDGIVSIFMMAKDMVAEQGWTGFKSYIVKFYKAQERLSTYKPKNKKLLTYPYNYLTMTNYQGAEIDLAYERFLGDQCEFLLTGDMTCNPSVVCIPRQYSGEIQNWSRMITLKGYPQVAYNIDSFKAWLAQTVGSLAVSTLATVTAAYSVGTASVMKAAGASVLGNVTSAMASTYQGVTDPNRGYGGGGELVRVALGVMDFGFIRKCITPEYAKCIDEYFSMYGYATHRVKIPNREIRPHWTYTKTIGCTIRGNMPAGDARAICDIYDSGITFWKKGDEIGHYNLDNSI